MASNQDAPVFADRYRFEPVENDWDVGRSGYTHLVYDLKKNRFGVIKRAETKSKQADELKNEIKALRALKGLGVPRVYETGTAIYGSQKYDYVVIEYIDAIHIEKNLGSLSKFERIEILAQFFGLLAEAHNRGIVNGDIDLKHLFWRKDKMQLIIIDWGNAKVRVDTRKKTEFAYDLARSAEIIYSIVSDKGHPLATGPLTLPDDTALISGLLPLPIKFIELCQWAPRKPINGIKAPSTALDLLIATNQWGSAILGEEYKKVPLPKPRQVGIQIGFFVFVLLAALVYFQRGSLGQIFSTPTLTTTQTQAVTFALSITPSAISVIPTDTNTPSITVVPTETATTILTPTLLTPTLAHRSYQPISELVFDNKYVIPDNKPCWETETKLTLTVDEGFYRRDNKYWEFAIIENEDTIPEERPIVTPAYVDFSQCLENKQVNGLGLNAWVTKIVPERDNPVYALGTRDPGREFGIFIENKDGFKREYTLWIDKDKTLHLKVRENDVVIYDNSELVVGSIQSGGGYPRPFNKFFIQIFLEINNNGMDALYLLEGSGNPVKADSLDPTKMILKSTLPTLGHIQEIGFVGYGGETQVLIWPLAFFESNK